ncbi:MAG: hypothetical protein RLZZ428_757 [Pseudomonadota bacterium]|jgi:uncharacterized alpha-E superfamily protein
MKHLSIRNADGLYWIGRYLQRFSILSKESIKAFDLIIDRHHDEGEILFAKVGYAIEYKDASDFFQVIAKEMGQGSLFSSLEAARDNAVELRDIIDDDLFSALNLPYIRLKTEAKPSVKFLVNILNEMYSFWGIIALKPFKDKVHQLLEFGRIVETIDMKLRLFEDISMVLFDFNRLNQLGKVLYPEFQPIVVNHSNIERFIQNVNSSIGQIIHYES